MTSEDILEKLEIAITPEAIFTRSNYRKEYLRYLKLIHPDVCQLPGANKAVEKLNTFRAQIEQQSQLHDDAGLVQQTDDKMLICKGGKEMLLRSLENYRRLMQLSDDASRHFQQYLPTSITLEGEHVRINYTHRIIPMTHLTLAEEHVSWILSRLLEFTAWLHQVGYCHAGFTPESLCVVPQTHGIICTSFYHLQPLGSRLQTISSKYRDWYPKLVFYRKEALPYVDLSLAQRTGLYLLGDKSGNGVKLKNTRNEQLVDFLITPHYDAYQTYDAYRKLLKSVFGNPKYYELNI